MTYNVFSETLNPTQSINHLRSLHRSASVSRHPRLRSEGFLGAKFYCQHAFADANLAHCGEDA